MSQYKLLLGNRMPRCEVLNKLISLRYINRSVPSQSQLVVLPSRTSTPRYNQQPPYQHQLEKQQQQQQNTKTKTQPASIMSIVLPHTVNVFSTPEEELNMELAIGTGSSPRDQYLSSDLDNNCVNISGMFEVVWFKHLRNQHLSSLPFFCQIQTENIFGRLQFPHLGKSLTLMKVCKFQLLEGLIMYRFAFMIKLIIVNCYCVYLCTELCFKVTHIVFSWAIFCICSTAAKANVNGKSHNFDVLYFHIFWVSFYQADLIRLLS